MSDRALVTATNSTDQATVSLLLHRQYFVYRDGSCQPHLHASIATDFIHHAEATPADLTHPALLKRDVDIYGWRRATDVIIQGVARSARPTSSLNVALDISGSGSLSRLMIIATGDRHVERGPFGWRLTEPEAFTEMPMRYDRAYGGLDVRARELFGDPGEIEFGQDLLGEDDPDELNDWTYPRNPAGRGYRVAEDGIDGTPWPNLEFHDDRLTLDRLVAPSNRWGERPYPACFDWFNHLWFPRIASVGEWPPTHDGQIPLRERELGFLPPNIAEIPIFSRPTHEFAQGAHPYLSRHRLVGDEQIRVTHMSPDGRDTVVRLPGHRPVVSMTLPGERESVVAAELDLVFLETETSQLSLLWRATCTSNRGELPEDWEEQTQISVRG